MIQTITQLQMTKKSHTFFKLGIPLLVLILLLAGCYPKGPEYYSDLDLTVTDYDPNYDFGNQKKYWIADTVEYITNIEDSEIEQEDVDELLAQINANLEERGHERIPVDQPDDPSADQGSRHRKAPGGGRRRTPPDRHGNVASRRRTSAPPAVAHQGGRAESFAGGGGSRTRWGSRDRSRSSSPAGPQEPARRNCAAP